MKKKKTKQSFSNKNETAIDKMFKSISVGLLITVGISIAMLLIGTGISLVMPDPLALIEPIGYFTLFASSFFGGMACTKINKSSPLPTAMLCGCAFVVLSMLCSFILPHTFTAGMEFWLRLLIHALSLLCFPLGAIVGKSSNKKSTKRIKRR